MNHSFHSRQRGVSLFGLLFVAVVLASVGVLGAQAFPTYVEYRSILKAVDKAKQGNSPQDARIIFDKAAQIDDIKSIVGKDLEIAGESSKMKISFAYSKEIHMAGPAYLLLKYTGTTN